MSLEGATYTILKAASGVTALVGGTKSPRIYRMGIPQGKTGAAVVVQVVGEPDDVTCDGQMGHPDGQIQITCWSAQGGSPDDARALADAVYTALTADAAKGTHDGTEIIYWAYLDGRDALSLSDESEQLTRYGKQQDWEVSFKR